MLGLDFVARFKEAFSRLTDQPEPSCSTVLQAVLGKPGIVSPLISIDALLSLCLNEEPAPRSEAERVEHKA